jgi:hypothetical protein
VVVGRVRDGTDRHPDDSGGDDPPWLGFRGRTVLGALDALADWLAPRRRPSRWVIVPDFVGRQASERSMLAVRAGVRTRCVSTTSRPAGDGIVVAQEPAAGTRVRRSTRVLLTVLHGPSLRADESVPAVLDDPDRPSR